MALLQTHRRHTRKPWRQRPVPTPASQAKARPLRALAACRLLAAAQLPIALVLVSFPRCSAKQGDQRVGFAEALVGFAEAVVGAKRAGNTTSTPQQASLAGQGSVAVGATVLLWLGAAVGRAAGAMPTVLIAAKTSDAVGC